MKNIKIRDVVSSMGYEYLPLKTLVEVAGMGKVAKYHERLNFFRSGYEQRRGINLLRTDQQYYERIIPLTTDSLKRKEYKNKLSECIKQLHLEHKQIDADLVNITAKNYVDIFGKYLPTIN